MMAQMSRDQFLGWMAHYLLCEEEAEGRRMQRNVEGRVGAAKADPDRLQRMKESVRKQKAKKG